MTLFLLCRFFHFGHISKLLPHIIHRLPFMLRILLLKVCNLLLISCVTEIELPRRQMLLRCFNPRHHPLRTQRFMAGMMNMEVTLIDRICFVLVGRL